MILRSLLSILLASLLVPGTVAKAAEDTTPPVLLGLTRSPAVIDTADADQTVTFTWELEDDGPSVVSSGLLMLQDPSMPYDYACSDLSQQDLVFGTLLHGVFETTMTFPQNCEQGLWQPYLLQFGDATGNYVSARIGDWPDPDNDLLTEMIESMSLDLDVLVITVIPEPSTFVLLGVGALVLLGWAVRPRLK